MTAWVETHFPWYVWDDEDEEEWSTVDKRALVEKPVFVKYYASLRGSTLSELREAGVVG